MQWKIRSMILPLLATAMTAGVAGGSGAAEAATAPVSRPPAVVVNGERLALPVAPAIAEGTTFVPLRGVFEKQGATVSWDDATRTVVAEKGATRLEYVVGASLAELNGKRIDVPLPGYITEGTTMVPLRLISEALGGGVSWDEKTRTVTIVSAIAETAVRWGVNFRTGPNVDSDVIRMLGKGETAAVLREIDEDWLLVKASDGQVGYISAGEKYTEYGAERAADRLIDYGMKFLGTPYEFGASPKQTNTFDCSSFVKHIFKEVLGMDLPRVSYNQAEDGVEVEKGELRKGDLLFFTARGLPIGHVGVYAGDGKVLHTYSKESGVEIAEFAGKWEKRFVTARRVY